MNKFVMTDENNMGVKFFKDEKDLFSEIEYMFLNGLWNSDFNRVFDIETESELNLDISVNVDFGL